MALSHCVRPPISVTKIFDLTTILTPSPAQEIITMVPLSGQNQILKKFRHWKDGSVALLTNTADLSSIPKTCMVVGKKEPRDNCSLRAEAYVHHSPNK